MPLEAELQQFVDAVAAHPLPDDLRALRAISESTLPQLQGAPQAVAHVIEQTLTTRDGHALELRLYTPDGLPDGPAPALLFAHGGGWQWLRDRRRRLSARAGTLLPGSAA
ncbi:hypothetical protein G6F68_017991 [Rhizopus microsporus]|nr:hypothetical protein G6F68_017991 [Rhizopus microsporus]